MHGKQKVFCFFFVMALGIMSATFSYAGVFGELHAGIGIGFYRFVTDLVWEAELADTTMEVARQVLDNQFCLGWRGVLGADFFFTPQFGASVDFLYDHVFDLKRIDGTEAVNKTSCFHGFTVGFVYMFQSE